MDSGLPALPPIIDLVADISEPSDNDVPSSSVGHDQTLRYIDFNPSEE